MTPKEWFESVREARRNLRATLARRQEYLDIATNITSRPADTAIGSSGGTPSSRVEAGALRMAALAEQLGEQAARMQELVLQAESVIAQLRNTRHRQVLTLRYLNDYKWKDVAEIMGYEDVRGAHDAHGRALAAAERYLPKE